LFTCSPDGAGEFISAGHNPSYLYRVATNTIEELESTGLILGAFDFATYRAKPLHFERGDVLLVYSDGLTDAESESGEMFGEERVKDLVVEHAREGADQLNQALLTSVEEWTKGRTQTDDITLIIAERT
jgi:sigma-B regulation protein RsbU (phosphoserine phosphatase)